MENKSQVLLKAGDRVITSKGNIGDVVEPTKIVVGYYKYADKFIELETLPVDSDFRKSGDCVSKWQNSYPNDIIMSIHSPVIVKLGKKTYSIAESNLTKLDTLFPVRVIWNDDLTGQQQDNETVVYLPKDFCLLCNHDKVDGSNLYSRIIPFLQSQVGVRDYITIFKIYAL